MWTLSSVLTPTDSKHASQVWVCTVRVFVWTRWPYLNTRLLDGNSAAGRTTKFSPRKETLPKVLAACWSALRCQKNRCVMWQCVFEAATFRFLCWMIITTHRTETSFLCFIGASLTCKNSGEPGARLCRSYFTAQSAVRVCVCMWGVGTRKKRGLWGWE